MPDAGWALATFSDISDRKRDELIIQSLAQEDSLTGLVNRRSFDLKLQQALNHSSKEHQMPSLLLLDLDNFKSINDSFGHLAGDEVLISTSSRLKCCVDSDDVVARIGGDEFAIILAKHKTDAQIEVLCKEIVTSMAGPFPVKSNSIQTGISIGVSRITTNQCTPHELLSSADNGLYQAKRNGRNCWRFGS